MRPVGTPAELERRRRRAVALVEGGESPSVVARILGVTCSSLRRWRRLACHGLGLAAKPAPGPRPRLDDQQLATLEGLLGQGAVAHGWPNHLWTSKRVAALIRRHFGVCYHPDHVRRLLNRRLRWTSQKPQKRARQRDLKEVERWIADDWPRIIRQAFQRRARIALLDESGFLLSPVVNRTMAPRGKTPILDCSDKHDRISVISAITLSPRALRVGLHFMLLGDNENFHGEEVLLFLRQLKGEIGGPWTIVWDRNQIHARAKVVKAWLAKHPEVVVEDFPSHAPDTNPDEDVWSWTKYGRLCNLAPADVDELRQHVWGALVALMNQPQLLTSFILHARVPLLLR
ncbi:MAG: IS630 family transposase [Gemmataceae bacterium]